MTGSELSPWLLVIELFPTFLGLGILLSTLFLAWDGERVRVVLSKEEAMGSYCSFGGIGPLFPAAVVGIAFGFAIELAAIPILAGTAYVLPGFGVEEFRLNSTLLVMVAAAFAYWAYLKTQSWIRSTRTYQGWP